MSRKPIRANSSPTKPSPKTRVGFPTEEAALYLRLARLAAPDTLAARLPQGFWRGIWRVCLHIPTTKAPSPICSEGHNESRQPGLSMAEERKRRAALTVARPRPEPEFSLGNSGVPEGQYGGRGLKSRNGFGVIEIVVAVAIIGLVFFGVYQFAIVASASVHASVRQVEAAYLAEEGIEVVRTLRHKSWDTEIAPLTAGTTYYPSLVNNSWTLSATNPGLIDNLFTGTVVLQEVLRDSDDNIASSGTIDPDTRKITVTVAWDEKGSTRQVVLETYVTNFLQN